MLGLMAKVCVVICLPGFSSAQVLIHRQHLFLKDNVFVSIKLMIHDHHHILRRGDNHHLPHQLNQVNCNSQVTTPKLTLHIFERPTFYKHGLVCPNKASPIVVLSLAQPNSNFRLWWLIQVCTSLCSPFPILQFPHCGPLQLSGPGGYGEALRHVPSWAPFHSGSRLKFAKVRPFQLSRLIPPHCDRLEIILYHNETLLP